MRRCAKTAQKFRLRFFVRIVFAAFSWNCALFYFCERFEIVSHSQLASQVPFKNSSISGPARIRILYSNFLYKMGHYFLDVRYLIILIKKGFMILRRYVSYLAIFRELEFNWQGFDFLRKWTKWEMSWFMQYWLAWMNPPPKEDWSSERRTTKAGVLR